MALKTVPEMRNVKCVELFGLIAQDDLRLSPSKYDETQVSARKTGVTRLNVQGTGANLGHRAKIYQLIAKLREWRGNNVGQLVAHPNERSVRGQVGIVRVSANPAPAGVTTVHLCRRRRRPNVLSRGKGLEQTLQEGEKHIHRIPNQECNCQRRDRSAICNIEIAKQANDGSPDDSDQKVCRCGPGRRRERLVPNILLEAAQKIGAGSQQSIQNRE